MAKNRFTPIQTEEEVRETLAKNALYKHPDAIGFEAYCVRKKIGDPVMKAGMRQYRDAKGLKAATFDNWEDIFRGYGEGFLPLEDKEEK